MMGVPEGWKATRLGSAFHSRRERGFDGLQTLSVTLRDGLVERSTLDRKTDTNLSSAGHLLVRSGDIAYNMMRMWQGALGLATHDAIVSPAYIVLQPKQNIDSLYAAYLFKTPRVVYLFWAYSYGLTNDRLRLYFKDFGLIPACLPPLPEQQKIAEILSVWDRAIEVTEGLIKNSQAQKKALMQQLLTARHRLLGFNGKWKYLIFDSVFKTCNDKKTQIAKKQYLNEGVTPIVDQGQQKIVGYTDQENTYSDIPVIIFGDHTRILKWIDFRFCPGADGTQILKTKKNINLRFGYYLLQHTELPNLGYSRHMRELKEKEFLVPPILDEQTAIAAILSDADRDTELLTQKLTHLKQEKSALMQQLLTGKRRVKIDKEIAA